MLEYCEMLWKNMCRIVDTRLLHPGFTHSVGGKSEKR
jgi:hypothetical protein